MTSQQPRAEEPRGFSQFHRILAACVATRIVVDTSIQLFFSFLQVIALGMGLNVIVLGRLLSLRSAVGLTRRCSAARRIATATCALCA